MKKLIFTAIIIMCASLPLNAYAENSHEEDDGKDVPIEWELAGKSEAYWQNHDRASVDMINLQTSFGSSEGLLTASDYPENYGGCYVNEDGNLVIFVLGNIESARKEFAERTGNANIIVQECSFSYRRLKEAMDAINAFQRENTDSEIAQNISFAALMDAENYVLVGLSEFSQERIDEFRQSVSSDECFEFIQSEGGIIFEDDVLGDVSPANIPIAATPIKATNTRHLWLALTIIVFMLGTLAIALFRRTRPTHAMQANSGSIVAENSNAGNISEKQIVAAIETSARTPSDEVYKALAGRIREAYLVSDSTL